MNKFYHFVVKTLPNPSEGEKQRIGFEKELNEMGDFGYQVVDILSTPKTPSVSVIFQKENPHTGGTQLLK